MEITVREAAALLGCSPRAIRSRIERGTLPARRSGARWWLRTEDVPLTAEQRDRTERRAEGVRETVEDGIQRALGQRRSRSHRSILDLDSFCIAKELYHELATQSAPDGALTAVRAEWRGAILALVEGAHAFDPPTKIERLRAARGGFSRALAALVLVLPEPRSESLEKVVTRVEEELLPSLGGLLRWSESLRKKRR